MSDRGHASWGSPNKWKIEKFWWIGIEDRAGRRCCATQMDQNRARTNDSGYEQLRFRGARYLFHFSRGRTHGGGLPGLGVNADQSHASHSAAADGDHVAASPQVGLHCFGEGVGHGEAA